MIRPIVGGQCFFGVLFDSSDKEMVHSLLAPLSWLSSDEIDHSDFLTGKMVRKLVELYALTDYIRSCFE